MRFPIAAFLRRLFFLVWFTKTQWHVSQADPVVDLKAPPMGFMSWERFRCQTDCVADPLHCVSDALYRSMADALVLHGYAAAGYTQVSIDDCWTHGRDPTTGQLRADPRRFPQGIAALADYLHSRGLQLGIYADAGHQTCAHFEGSQNHQEIDARTFAEWGVDYIKLDGCHINPSSTADKYQTPYVAFGKAIRKAATTRNMVFSCSWPAYIGDNETEKPFDVMYHQAGCNTWRNYKDIDNQWEQLLTIILHWGDYWQDLQNIPDGSFNDADMLLAGDDHYGHVLPLPQAKLQLGFWAMIASPLFIGGDVRTISDDYRAILLNPHIIDIHQDVSRRQADCVVGCNGIQEDTPTSLQQVWSKSLQQGHSRALAFFNLQGTTTTATTIQYMYSVEGAVAQCVDLWASDPTQDVCAHGKGAKPHHWDIQVMPHQDKDGQQQQVSWKIRALGMEPTSHRMLRIDYFCATPSRRDPSDATAFGSSQGDPGLPPSSNTAELVRLET